MSARWKALCREARLRYENESITVPCGNGRCQEVRVDDTDPSVIRLWSRVVRRGRLPPHRPELQRPEIEAWLINRYRELVGFKVTERGTIIGEAWVPMIELNESEWSIYVHTVAKDCDRLEYLWTGVDQE